MHQAILMHPNIHKHAEINHISHRSRQHHALLQILHGKHITAQNRGRGILTGISSRLFQFTHDILQGWHTDSQLCRCFFWGFDFLCQTADPLCRNICQAIAAQRKQALRRRIAFGMHARSVQRHFAFGQPQKAGALLVCLRAKLCYL